MGEGKEYFMKIAVLGGIWSLGQRYRHEVEKQGHECVHYNCYESNLRASLSGVDAIIMFTNTISHQASGIARQLARGGGVPLLCTTGSGVSALRQCLGSLATTQNPTMRVSAQAQKKPVAVGV